MKKTADALKKTTTTTTKTMTKMLIMKTKMDRKFMKRMLYVNFRVISVRRGNVAQKKRKINCHRMQRARHVSRDISIWKSIIVRKASNKLIYRMKLKNRLLLVKNIFFFN
jgi:hypothetical protein